MVRSGIIKTLALWPQALCIIRRNLSISSVQHMDWRQSAQDSLANPLTDLESLLEVPLLQEQDSVFNPTPPDVLRAQSLFGGAFVKGKGRSPRGLDISVHPRVVEPESLPKSSVPEVAFVGRSNAGKSALLDRLFHHNPALKIKVSKTPGRTKCMNFYQVGKAFSLVDMPGYGENMPQYYEASMEQYLKTRKRLSRTFLLIDSAAGLSEFDRIGLAMLEEFGKPYTIVLTKIDLGSASSLLKTVLAVQKLNTAQLHCCFPQPFLVSSVSGAGVAFLRAFIAYSTGNLSLAGH